MQTSFLIETYLEIWLSQEQIDKHSTSPETFLAFVKERYLEAFSNVNFEVTAVEN